MRVRPLVAVGAAAVAVVGIAGCSDSSDSSNSSSDVKTVKVEITDQGCKAAPDKVDAVFSLSATVPVASAALPVTVNWVFSVVAPGQ